MDEFNLRYQAVYIDQKSTKWQDKIVFIKEVFPNPSTNVVILKSLRLEDNPGVVLSGTIDRLRYLRKTLETLDNKHRVGDLPTESILKVLNALIIKNKLKIVYKQNIELESTKVTAGAIKNGIWDFGVAGPRVTAGVIKNIFNGLWGFGKDFKSEWNKQGNQEKKEQEDLLTFLRENWKYVQKAEKVFEKHPQAAYLLENLNSELKLTGKSLGLLATLMKDPQWINALGLSKYWAKSYERDNTSEADIIKRVLTVAPKNSVKETDDEYIITLDPNTKEYKAIERLLESLYHDEKEIQEYEIKAGDEVYRAKDDDALEKLKTKFDREKIEYKVDKVVSGVVMTVRKSAKRKKFKRATVTDKPRLSLSVQKLLGLAGSKVTDTKPEKLKASVENALKALDFDPDIADINVNGDVVTIEVQKAKFAALQNLILTLIDLGLSPKDIKGNVLSLGSM